MKKLLEHINLALCNMQSINLDFETKIHEALLIKKHNPGLNQQLFANRSSFLLNIYCYLLINILNCYLDFAWCIGFRAVVLHLHF